MKKKDKGAIKRFSPSYIRRFRSDYTSEKLSAEALAYIGQTEKATSILEQRYQRTNQFEDLLAYGKLLSEYGSRAHAEAVLDKVLLIDSLCAEAYYLQGRVRLKRTVLERFFEGKERTAAYKDALALTVRAIQIDSTNALYISFGVSLLDSLGSYIEACLACSLASERILPNKFFDRQCGSIYKKMDKIDGALFHFERAYVADLFDVDNLLDIEWAHKKMGNWREYYLTSQERLADAMPDTLSIRYNLAIEYLNRDSLEKAEASFRKVLKKNPEFAEANKALAAVLAKSGRHEEALIYMQRNKAVTGANPKNDYAEGQLLLLKGDTAAAVAVFEKLVVNNQFNYDAAYFLATLAYNEGDWDRVIALIRDPLKFRDKSGASLMAGTALFKLKTDLQKSFEFLKSCEITEEADEGLCSMLAELAFELKYYGEAEERYKKCMSNYPDSPNVPYYKSKVKESDKLR